MSGIEGLFSNPDIKQKYDLFMDGLDQANKIHDDAEAQRKENEAEQSYTQTT